MHIGSCRSALPSPRTLNSRGNRSQHAGPQMTLKARRQMWYAAIRNSYKSAQYVRLSVTNSAGKRWLNGDQALARDCHPVSGPSLASTPGQDKTVKIGAKLLYVNMENPRRDVSLWCLLLPIQCPRESSAKPHGWECGVRTEQPAVLLP